MATKIVLLLAIVCLAQVLAAPKPIDWKQVKDRALNFGRDVVPAVKTGCQLLNGRDMHPPPQVYYIPYQYQFPQGPQGPQGNTPLQYSPLYPYNTNGVPQGSVNYNSRNVPQLPSNKLDAFP